ncbi:hypothetical protein BT63DRAFT_459264 [Microthyrium microscopicum]|uniref:C2H2-type domain-containing protein n=1 Tax=Microthyrium microscopicum TaxID=703497 RepID=A0A6A6U223_9PEZI|nr:hypothetical protein BT63DRAFT_459264 [Microthyrium microscopicum]
MSVSLAKRYSGPGLLSLNTDVDTESKRPLSPVGLLTPLSATSRRTSNFSSTWSSASSSQGSSGSSFQSQEPTTPPYHGMPVSPYMMVPSQELEKPFDHIDMISSPLHSRMLNSSREHTSTPAWTSLSFRDHDIHDQLPSSYSTHSAIQAPQLTNIYGSQFLPRTEDTTRLNSAFPKNWNDDEFNSQISASGSYPNSAFVGPLLNSSPLPSYGHSVNGSHWPPVSHSYSLNSSSTIVPSQTLMDPVEAKSMMDTDSGSEMHFRSPSHQTYSHSYQSSTLADDGLDSSIIMDHEADHTDSSMSAANYTPTRRSQEEKRAHRIQRKRIKKQKENQASLLEHHPQYRGLPIDVNMPAPKRHECDFTTSDGDICGKKFQRVEHLKRHMDTHSGEIFYYCPAPNCGKRFQGRKDNLREHFKTHLRGSPTSRNSNFSLPEFYTFLYEKFDHEEAQKFVAKLQKWAAGGGQTRQEAGTGGRRGGNSFH